MLLGVETSSPNCPQGGTEGQAALVLAVLAVSSRLPHRALAGAGAGARWRPCAMC